MDAYEFYWRDTIKGYQPIGVLPERRKNPARITQKSIINLARELIGDNADANNIFFVKITKDENTGEILRPDSVYRQLKEYFKDRRRYPRISMDLPLEYLVKYDARAHGGIVIDASETGFLIYSIEDIPVGTKLKIAVLFPKEYELAIFEVFAETIRKEFVAEREDWYQEGYQYGLKFIQILEEDYWKLRKLLSGRFK
jgi:c-di-GMP-binding flagellar brake protein YcgR